MTTPKNSFADTIQQNDPSGTRLSHLLTVRPSLEAVGRYLHQWNRKPHHVHVCGWERDGAAWMIPTDEIEEARKGAP